MPSFLRPLSTSLSGLLLFAAIPAFSQLPAARLPVASRITQPVDDARLSRLSNSVHPAVRSAADLGLVDASLPMERVQLVLQRSPESQAAFDAFTSSQYDPASSNYHHWLSPDQVGTLYGTSDADLAKVTLWLQSQGFTVNSVSKGRLVIDFSGTAGQVQNAFHTQIHKLSFAGENHIANVTAPSIPEALTPVVSGLLSLHNFFPKSTAILGPALTRDAATGRFSPVAGTSPDVHTNSGATANPLFTGPLPGRTTPGYYVSPFDFATIYNSLPLWNAGNTGAGVNIAIVARTEVIIGDITAFQTTFNLPINPPTILHNGPIPYTSTSNDRIETTLDVEWAGAAAPGARIDLVVSKSTSTSDGVDLSSLYIVDNQIAPIMSVSYGTCEAFLGSANSFYASLSQQAAAEGISVFTSAGDSGAAGCDDFDQSSPYVATHGLAVSGFASPPYVTAVGGTDFNDFNDFTTYWNATNAPNGSSAKGYIPELPWNDTCANPLSSSLSGFPSYTPSQFCNYASTSAHLSTYSDFFNVVGGSGGVSTVYNKPSWQTGTGVPADGKRDIPDVSLFASGGFLSSAYAYYYNGTFRGGGGTSFSSPAMAGLMALIVHQQGSAQGLANPPLYQLFGQETLSSCNSSTVANGNSCVFYDTTFGNNITPCSGGTPNCVVDIADPNYTNIGVLPGNATTTGYDLATGLGSVNATNLVHAWNSVAPEPTVTTITLTPATLPSATVGGTYTAQLSAGGGTAPYTYFVSGGSLPPWMTLTPHGILTGVPATTGSYSFTITARDSSLNGPFVGSQTYTQVAVAAGPDPVLAWHPARLFIYNGFIIGADVLNATIDSIPGAQITYTATLANDTTPSTIASNYYLQPGTYTLTASYGALTASIPFRVIPERIWIVNSSGSLVVLDAAGGTYAVPFTGGMGIAIDNGGTAWSANTAGTSLTASSNTGQLTASGPAVGGINSPAAIAIDGNGFIWTANANNSLSAISPSGVALSPSTGFTGGALSTPSGITIDISGNVWVSNSGNDSVTEILGGAAPVQPLATAQTQSNLGAKP